MFTPPEGRIFPGITRKTILGLCRELGIQVNVRPIQPSEVLDAEAAFLCGTATEITPISSVEQFDLKPIESGTISHTVFQAFHSLVTERSGSLVIV